MRRLLLLRHAKAERSQPGGRDHDRILTERGRTEAARIGTYLARHKLVPDIALVSTAARTRETWARLAAAFDSPPAADFESDLYEAEPETVLKLVRSAKSSASTVLVIGHNPTLHEVAALLIASGDIEARQRLLEDFPTCALAAVSFSSGDWNGVHAHGGRLEHFVTPRWLEAPTA